MRDGVAIRLAPLLGRILLGSAHAPAADLPIRVIAWDGSSVGPAAAPAFVIRHRRALRRLLWKPGEMGLVRAYIAGELDIEGDAIAALGAVQRVMRRDDEPLRLSSDDKREIVRTAVTLGAVGPEPKPPAEELPPSPAPLDELPDFAHHVLGSSMAHTCGAWPASSLEAAQRAAHDRVSGVLRLQPGARLLDLSCGWGAFACHVAAQGVQVVALTHSPAQAAYVRDRAAGLPVEVRLGDHTVVSGVYDAVVGLTPTAPVPPEVRDLLAPGGRLLIQRLARRPGPPPSRRTFTTSYVGQDNLPTLGEIVDALEAAALEVREVTARREDHARTLRAWATALQANLSACAAATSPPRARIWLLYLAAAALACESGRLSCTEVCAVRPIPEDHHTRDASPETSALTA